MFSEEMEVASLPWGSHPHGAKGLWALGGPTVSTGVGHRTDPKPYARRWVEAVVKPREDWGVGAPALKLHLAWEGPWKKGQGFKPDLGNPAVRHYRGASGNVAVVDIFPRTAGAPEFYPKGAADKAEDLTG